jgi:hypothetical protein
MVFELTYEVVGEVPTEIATHQVHLPETFTFANYTVFAAGLATALNNIILGKILSATLSLNVDISAITSNPAALIDSDNEAKAKFQFLAANGDSVPLTVPGLDDQFVIASTHQLDQSATEIAALITAMEDGIAVTAGVILPSSVAEFDIVSVITAEEIFTRSAKRSVS